VFVAQSDADRTKGYVFELVATPTTNSNVLATLGQINRSEWAPTNRYGSFGFWPLLLSTLLITLIALAIATPPSIMTAILLSEQAPSRLREWLKPVIELLASVPTVVLGYFGLMLVAPALVEVLGEALRLESGRCLFTAALVMSVLISPTLISISEDALRSVPRSVRDGAAALGLTSAETLRKALLPAARAGLIGAVLLGFARAIGETMIVWILSGGTALMPSLDSPLKSLVQTTRGVPDTIGIEMANVEFEMPHYGHLFLLGVILFVFVTLVNLTGYYFAKRRTWQL
jgi:phosphate transport system permease protein